MTPLNQRRWGNFRANRRGYYSLWIFTLLFGVSLFAEFLANDKPLLVYFDGDLLVPVVAVFPETRFGGEFPTEADYRDDYVVELIEAKGWMVWPPIPFAYDTIVRDRRAPAPPSTAIRPRSSSRLREKAAHRGAARPRTAPPPARTRSRMGWPEPRQWSVRSRISAP